ERIAARAPIASIARWTTRLLSACKSRGILATRRATLRTAPSSWSGGKARLANPICAASIPFIESPVSIISIALRRPISHGWYAQSGDDIARTGGGPRLAPPAGENKTDAGAPALPPP